MRQTLLFGGLESLARNVNRKAKNLRFFEVGNVYSYSADKDTPEAPIKAYSQDYHLALWVTGKYIEGSWAHADADSSVFQLKAYVYNILKRAGVSANMLVEGHSENNIFSEGITLKSRAGRILVDYGKLSHKVLAPQGIDQDVYYAEFDWTGILKAIKKKKIEFKELSKYPSVSRDLALLVDENVEFAQIEQLAYQSEKKLLKRVELFDVYQGKNLPKGKKSYAVNFILEDEEKTLNDKQIDAIMKKLINNLTTKLGAELR